MSAVGNPALRKPTQALINMRDAMIDIGKAVGQMDVAPGSLGKLEPEKRKRTRTPVLTEVEKERLAQEAHVPKTPAKKLPAKKGKPTIQKGNSGARSPVKRTPKFKCVDHGVDLVYDTVVGHWLCPQSGCMTARKAAISAAGTVTKISGAPKIVVQMDSDGDYHYYLHYDAHNLMIELPYEAVVGHKVFSNQFPPTLVVNVHVDDFVFLDDKSQQIKTAEILDR